MLNSLQIEPSVHSWKILMAGMGTPNGSEHLYKSYLNIFNIISADFSVTWFLFIRIFPVQSGGKPEVFAKISLVIYVGTNWDIMQRQSLWMFVNLSNQNSHKSGCVDIYDAK